MKKTILFLIVFNLCLQLVNAQWTGSANVAAKVCTANGEQSNSFIIADGSGGAIIFWEDSRSGTSTDIYYNKLNAAGLAVWSSTSVGLSLTNTSVDSYLDQVISDGSGGAFVSWEADNELLVQHVNSTGVKTWAASGVSLSSTGYAGFLCSDGSGGIIATWSDFRADLVDENPRSYAQRISSAGAKMWAVSGVQLVASVSLNASMGILADGSGGAIIPMIDTRNSNYDAVADEYDNIDVYAQRINASGNMVWAAAGVPVCTQSNNQDWGGGGQYPYIIADGAGGAVIGWEDYRNDPNNGNSDPYNTDIFCQRINASGAAQWTTNGVALCVAAGAQYELSLMPDGSGGAVAAWYDERNTFRVYTQKINGSGVVQWATNGIAVASETNSFRYTASPDATNSYMLVTWVANDDDIKAEKISVSNGNLNWGGVLVCGLGDALSPAITHNGGSGAIISWTDGRNYATSENDIYANLVPSSGVLPLTLISFEAQLIDRNALLSWSTSSEQNTSYFEVERSKDGSVFSKIGRVHAAGNSSSIRNYSFADNAFVSGTNFYRLKMVDADGRFTYSKTVAIRVDGNSNALQIFPNPAKGILHVQVPGSNENAMLIITDMTGRKVKQQKINGSGNTSFSIDIDDLPKGTYNLLLKGKSLNEHQKFVKD